MRLRGLNIMITELLLCRFLGSTAQRPRAQRANDRRSHCILSSSPRRRVGPITMNRWGLLHSSENGHHYWHSPSGRDERERILQIFWHSWDVIPFVLTDHTQRCIAYVFWTDRCWLKWFVLFSSWRGNVEHTLRWRCFRRNTTDIGSDRYQTTTTTSLQAQDRRCLQLITTSKYSINGQTNYPLYNAEDLCFSIYFELFMVSRTIRVISYYSTTSLTIGVIIYYSKISQTICYSKLHLRSE